MRRLTRLLPLLCTGCLVIGNPSGGGTPHGLVDLAAGTGNAAALFGLRDATREDVLTTLGAPDAVLFPEGTLVYVGSSVVAYLLMVGMYGGGVAFPLGDDYLLFVAVDDAGRVTRHALVRVWLGGARTEFPAAAAAFRAGH